MESSSSAKTTLCLILLMFAWSSSPLPLCLETITRVFFLCHEFICDDFQVHCWESQKRSYLYQDAKKTKIALWYVDTAVYVSAVVESVFMDALLLLLLRENSNSTEAATVPVPIDHPIKYIICIIFNFCHEYVEYCTKYFTSNILIKLNLERERCTLISCLFMLIGMHSFTNLFMLFNYRFFYGVPMTYDAKHQISCI